MISSKKKRVIIPSTANPKVGIMPFPKSFTNGFAEQIKKRFAEEPKQNRS